MILGRSGDGRLGRSGPGALKLANHVGGASFQLARSILSQESRPIMQHTPIPSSSGIPLEDSHSHPHPLAPIRPEPQAEPLTHIPTEEPHPLVACLPNTEAREGEGEGEREHEPAGLTWAYRLFWLTFVIFFASTFAGKLWDRVWHLTVRFDTFWSPPHFFVFVMTTLTSLLVALIAFTPSLRVWFGPTIRMPFIPFPVPGALVILGGGLVSLSITIMFDNFWHTAFGLDETQWSVPHDMLGWSWFTIIVGFVASRMAFRRYRPLNWITNLMIALLILAFMCPAVLGPFYLHYSPALIDALRSTPIVRTEPSAQHMYRVYLQFGLTRLTCPLFILMVSFFAGAAIVFLRNIDRRARIFLLAPLLWSLMFMGRDLYTIMFVHVYGAHGIAETVSVALHHPELWVPIPLFVAVLCYRLLERTSISEYRNFGICGLLFSLCTFAIWHTTMWAILAVIPAAFAMILGAWVGKWLYRMIEKPRLADLMRFLLISCAQIPAVLGIVDLIMRHATP